MRLLYIEGHEPSHRRGRRHRPNRQKLTRSHVCIVYMREFICGKFIPLLTDQIRSLLVFALAMHVDIMQSCARAPYSIPT